MIARDLRSKWESLAKSPSHGDYKSIRVSAECYSDIFLGVSPDGIHCLLLALPKDFDFDFFPITREKLSINVNVDKNFIVLSLLDENYRDLFDDLIISMYNVIVDIEDVQVYSSIFIKTFHKWVQFFDEQRGEFLNRSVIQGLFGELIILRALLTDKATSKVNDVLEAWRGPYDQGHDFVLEDKDIEVKTRVEANAIIRVTNEQQLDQLEGKGLELAVVCVDPEHADGVPLSFLVREVKDLVENSLGDVTILFKALSQKNLGPINLADYNHFTFKAVGISFYNCLDPEFPRIIRSHIRNSITRVRYSINTEKIEQFMISSEAL